MKNLKYEGGTAHGGRTHPGAESNTALTMVSLGTLSMLGTGLLAVGGAAWFFGDDTPLVALGRNAAIATTVVGGVLDAVASILLVRHQRNQGGGSIRPGNADS